MKQQHALFYGRKILERGCALAEKRLDYLTELFESGRWRRFHSEMDFLDNIREAKVAVETWQRLQSEAPIDHVRLVPALPTDMVTIAAHRQRSFDPPMAQDRYPILRNAM